MLPNNTKAKKSLHRETAHGVTGRLLALDSGEKRVGVAISDELQLTVRPLVALVRTNWKKLLIDIKQLITRFDAKAVVIGLPLSLDGVERSSAIKVRRLAEKLSLSVDISIFLQDERLTSVEAQDSLRESGVNAAQKAKLVDSESAAVILRDFIADASNRVEVTSSRSDKASTN